MRRDDCLIVLNPRRIVPVMEALDELDIPQIRIIGYTEREIADDVFPTLLDLHPHDWYWIVSDDAIVRRPALAAVRALMKVNPVVTGYSQRTHEEWVVNLTHTPLVGDKPAEGAYDFFEFREVVSWPHAVVPTYFAGMSLTGMSAEMWRRFPFGCFGGGPRDTGYSSDFWLSYKLQRAQIPIVAAREAFCYHWRTNWRSTGGEAERPNFDDKRIEVLA